MGKSNEHIVLYRKYRPRKLADVVGQDHITKPLLNELKSGKLAHAYLFTGPRGVGKTSVARIFSFEACGIEYSNNLPIDIIEIDGASNRRIDEIRELKDRIMIAPVSAKYKIYIIDEVHMLTKEAFNALLKTLEEPPSHAIFILATTEIQKLPATIISRTQRHSFRPISDDDISRHLKFIAEKEGFKYDPAALDMIAKISRGGLRDAISLLDQASSSGDITLDYIQGVLGLIPEADVIDLINIISTGDSASIVSWLENALATGMSPNGLASQIILTLRGQSKVSETWFRLIDDLLKVSSSIQPQISLEIALLRANERLNSDESNGPSEPAKIIDKPPRKIKKEQEPKQFNEQIEAKEKPIDTTTISKLEDDKWQQILNSIKKSNNALYSVVRMSQPQISDGKLSLVFRFDFHQKQIDSAKNKQLLSKIVEDVTGSKIEITTATDKNSAPSSSKKPEPDYNPNPESEPEGPISSVMQTFGGGEVVNI